MPKQLKIHFTIDIQTRLYTENNAICGAVVYILLLNSLDERLLFSHTSTCVMHSIIAQFSQESLNITYNYNRIVCVEIQMSMCRFP